MPAASHGEDFRDPLENYDPKTYRDDLERALAEEPVAAIQHEPFVAISPETTIEAAVQKLAGLHVACLLVTEGDQLVGLVTDRDILNRVALEYADIKDHPVREIMTTNPVVVYSSDAAAAVLSVMAVVGYRHVPVLDAKQRPVGIVSPQRITNFLQKYMAI